MRPEERADVGLAITSAVMLAVLVTVVAQPTAPTTSELTDDLRYTGLALQLLGVGLAAWGVRTVRRQWTDRPGIPGTIRRAVSRGFGLDALQDAIERLLRLIFFKPRLKHRRLLHAGDLAFGSDLEATLTTTAPPPGADTSARLDWLEAEVEHLRTSARVALEMLAKERAERQQLLAVERSEREQAAADARRALADFAGGGLRLQSWGVVCLLVGITLATIPAGLAGLAP